MHNLAERLVVARSRLANLRPMPHHYVSYRTALLERILNKHYDEVKNRKFFRADEFMDVVKDYTPEIHQRRFGLL